MGDRELPSIAASKLIVFQHYLDLERKLRTVKPRIDNSPPRTSSVNRCNKLRNERKRAIESENWRVAMRMVAIAKEKSRGASPRERGKSLNFSRRKRESAEIELANRAQARHMKAIESAYPQKDFITFAEKTSRYSRQISYFQNGRDMKKGATSSASYKQLLQHVKNALHPPLTPCLLRQVRKQSGEWHSDLRYIHTEVLESTKKAAAKSRSTPDNC